jgi:hypothetical protein
MFKGVPGGPPISLTMQADYASEAAFNADLADYHGPESVILDGTEVKWGMTPALEYFSHSGTGHVNTTGPTN